MSWLKANELVKKDLELFKNFERYVDLVWKNKNQHYYFVEVKNEAKLNVLKDHISLFNMKTITNVCGIYNEITWSLVEQQINRFQ